MIHTYWSQTYIIYVTILAALHHIFTIFGWSELLPWTGEGCLLSLKIFRLSRSIKVHIKISPIFWLHNNCHSTAVNMRDIIVIFFVFIFWRLRYIILKLSPKCWSAKSKGLKVSDAHLHHRLYRSAHSPGFCEYCKSRYLKSKLVFQCKLTKQTWSQTKQNQYSIYSWSAFSAEK